MAGTDDSDQDVTRLFLNGFQRLPMTVAIAERAFMLRRDQKLKLPGDHPCYRPGGSPVVRYSQHPRLFSSRSANPRPVHRLACTSTWPQAPQTRYNIPMQFLSLSRRLTDKFPPEAFTPELAARETARVKELYASGILRQIWKRGDIPGASILWEAGSKAEVESAIASLPIFQAGMLEVVALLPLEPYPGFGA